MRRANMQDLTDQQIKELYNQKFPCFNCGKEFLFGEGWKKDSRMYCSKACRIAFIKKLIEKRALTIVEEGHAKI
jgi:hypothetical protein